MTQTLNCIQCKEAYSISYSEIRCSCGGLLEVKQPISSLSKALLQSRLSNFNRLDQSGVWRFREDILDLPSDSICSHPEGNTPLYTHPKLSKFANLDHITFKHEGLNPTGSFKDRGMTVAVSHGVSQNKNTFICASTGNTSASLASYAAMANKQAVVLVPQGQVAIGKLSQALGYGARCIAVEGDFDIAMQLVLQAQKSLGLYLVNSLNPYRIEGQKTIIWEMLQQRDWNAPDWIVVPGGNLGNTSAFAKAIIEAHQKGWIDKLPQIACIQSSSANPFYQSFKSSFSDITPMTAQTRATAINIGNPVNFPKAKNGIQKLKGLVYQVSDEEIFNAKRQIDQAGIGCEPASAATLAGVRSLRKEGTILESSDVMCILTGHILKDPQAILDDNRHKFVKISAELSQLEKQLL